jgi:hypothetical protein
MLPSTLRRSKESAMNWFKRSFGAVLLIAAASFPFMPRADAGRREGPTTTLGSVPGQQSVSYTMTLLEGEAVIGVQGNGYGNLDLVVADSDGNVTVGRGSSDRKIATVDVYRAGTFRIVVRNRAQWPNDFRLLTN